MDVRHETVCGIDVHQKNIVCCILKGSPYTTRPKKIEQTFSTTTFDLYNALEWMVSYDVTHIFMESTGQYWVPIYNIFDDSDMTVILANPAHIKNVPGRKTDVKDAHWIADLGRHELIMPSYLPEQASRNLRLLTRQRQSDQQTLTQIKNEIHNILQRCNIKLTSYLTDIFGKTGQALLSMFVNGEVINEATVSEHMHGKVKATAANLVKAMQGKMSQSNRYLLEIALNHYHFLLKQIKHTEQVITAFVQEYFPDTFELLVEIPGISAHIAATILAEIGPNVEAFKTVGHLASWAGMAPGSYESAGKKKSSRITFGNRYLKRALFIAGGSAGRSTDPAFSALYQRLSERGSKMKAHVACGHKLLRVIYKILSCHIHYNKGKAFGQRLRLASVSEKI